MAMNRRAAVASKLLKQAGYTGDLTRLAESLPPETLVQFDKLLNHKEPSVGPGMDSGIVVAYKSGEVVQDARTKEMTFPIAELIAFASRLMTLEPGDVLLTGTPAGVGRSRIPPRYLCEGDILEVEIERLGRLRNPVRADRT